MSSAKPTRKQADLADVLELILDKGIVINADIAITVGETEMIGVEIRAAIASFETAAEYGLAFPSGTDMRRVERASGREPLDEAGEGVDLGIDASSGGESAATTHDPPSTRPHPSISFEETEGDDGDEPAESAESAAENDPEGREEGEAIDDDETTDDDEATDDETTDDDESEASAEVENADEGGSEEP